ncbi:MAG: hypothetical protein JSR59_27335 [Proteobacteria bacterium]|nr:hypothetical protein [Pseudomonadota bacterium]
MPSATRLAVVAARLAPERKAALNALAARQGLSASTLLALFVETVLRDNEPPLDARVRDAAVGSRDRITVRLRRGDRSRLDSRAAARGQKSATYLAMLIRAHVRQAPPLPAPELATLKDAVNRLAALDRHLVRLAAPGSPLDATDMASLLRATTKRVDNTRQAVANIVRANLISWETPDA